MACKDAFKTRTAAEKRASVTAIDPFGAENAERLHFGVDSNTEANIVLQNNLELFEWVIRNKIYPCFIGRNISGERALSKEEILFLHKKACKIAALYFSKDEKKTEENGKRVAKQACDAAEALDIPLDTAIFLVISEDSVTRDFMRGYATALLDEGYTPAFQANTDARFVFDREFSGGMQSDKDIFSKCLIWATSPTVTEYDRMTTTHLIHPDNWSPFAPSAITRKEIAVWQYGKECHTIEDDAGIKTSFNLNLVRNEEIIIKKMF